MNGLTKIGRQLALPMLFTGGMVYLIGGIWLLHAGSHAYDDWLAATPPLHWLVETIPLMILALLLCLVYYALRPQNRQSLLVQ